MFVNILYQFYIETLRDLFIDKKTLIMKLTIIQYVFKEGILWLPSLNLIKILVFFSLL